MLSHSEYVLREGETTRFIFRKGKTRMRLIFKLKVIENESEYQAALQRRLELHGFACRGMPQRDEEGLLELLIQSCYACPRHLEYVGDRLKAASLRGKRLFLCV